MALLFLDTETTGVGENARLVQIAFKLSFSKEVVEGKFKPPVPIEVGAMAVHHITNKDVAGLGPFDESYIKEALMNLIKKNILVAHNAPFDIMILKNEGVRAPAFIDTLVCAKHLVKSEKYSLQYLRYLLDLDVEGTAHDALGDILVLEKLYERLTKAAAEKFGLKTEEEIESKMLEISVTPVLMQNFSFGKYRGKAFEEIAASDRGYLEWLHKSETSRTESEQKKDLVHTLEFYLKKSRP